MKKVIIKENAASLVSIIAIAIVAVIIVVTVIKLVTGGANVLSKAHSASTETQEAKMVDEINLLLASYKTDSYASSNEEESMLKFLEELKNKGTIQNYWSSLDLTIMKYHDSYILLKKENKNYIVMGSIPLLGEEYAQKTIDNYKKSISNANKETIKFETNNLYIITKDVKENVYEYSIPNSSEITLVIVDDVEINNKSKNKPAIELLEGSTLNLYSYANVRISSMYNGNEEIIYNNITDNPGYAGIYVPTGTTLNIKGNGTITAYGGPAGKGGTLTKSDYTLGNGGGGAGAGIGGNGGIGGIAIDTQSLDGGIGGSCGEVNLYGSVKVYAYGGAGAEGGDSTNEGAGAGGGYPGAGVGGGGAGGGGATLLVGAGGYSGGAAISLDETKILGGKDGLAGSHIEDSSKSEYYYSGGGYLAGPDGIDTKKVNRAEKCLGGFMGMGNDDTMYSSCGGTGGSGGEIVLSGISELHAYNGNKLTSSDNGNSEPLIINAQDGFTLEKYSYRKVENSNMFTLARNSKKKKVKKTDYGQGIGAGAGFIEGNNGKFKDYSEKK